MTTPLNKFPSNAEIQASYGSVEADEPQAFANDASGESELLAKMTQLMKGIAPCSKKMSCLEIWENIGKHRDLLNLPVVPCLGIKTNPKVYFLNSGDVSENIAEISMKLQAKYVQSETASSYSIWTETAKQLALNATSRRQCNGISPGRRLSHLAKRRQMFSKANLQQLAQNEPKNHRLAIKTTVGQRNLAKEFLEFNQGAKPRIPKRALFQSPDEPPVRPGFRTVTKQVPRRRLFSDLNQNKPVLELPHGGGCYDVSSWLASQPFVNGKKRSREDSSGNDRKRRCPRRSLDFSDASPSQTSEISSISSTPTVTLTNLHKQKLLWAVANALKEKQITHKHPEFKECAKKLFNQCRKNLATILALQVPSGTTEKMLTYARQHVDTVLVKLGHCGSVLSDLSNSMMNQSQPTIIAAGEGKENISRTPKRLARPRTWRSCIKSLKKNPTLRINRSISCDDLKENYPINRKRKREEISIENEENFNVIENTPIKETIPNYLETTVIMESPEKGDDDFCLPASQEDREISLFPALARNYQAPASPDLFEDELNFSSLEIPSQTNVIETLPDETNVTFDLSCIRNDMTLMNDATDVEDNTVENETDSEEMLTSTPMVTVPKHILRRNKPAWKVEAGPGLKIRVRLSKEWDIVGRQISQHTETDSGKDVSSTSEIDLKETPVETQIKNPLLMRLNSVETSGSSTENYSLMELQDKLEIERTLNADPSELSFFESSPNSSSNSDSAIQNHINTIVKISPEVTIECYSQKRFSVYESDSSDDDEPLSCLKEKTTLEDDLPLSRLVEAKPDEASDDDLPLSQLSIKKPKTPENRGNENLDSSSAQRESNSSDSIPNCLQNKVEILDKSEKILHQAFTEFSWLIHQKIQSTITDGSEFEEKIEKLNQLTEMSLVQDQLFSYFKQKTLEMRQQLDYSS